PSCRRRSTRGRASSVEPVARSSPRTPTPRRHPEPRPRWLAPRSARGLRALRGGRAHLRRGGGNPERARGYGPHAPPSREKETAPTPRAGGSPMTDFDDFVQALREEHDGSSERAAATRARIMVSLH